MYDDDDISSFSGQSPPPVMLVHGKPTNARPPAVISEPTNMQVNSITTDSVPAQWQRNAMVFSDVCESDEKRVKLNDDSRVKLACCSLR